MLGIRIGTGWGFELTNVLTGEKLGIFEAGYGIHIEQEEIMLLRAKPIKF